MNTRLSLLTKNVRSVLAASAAFSVMATAPVYAQEAETEAKAEDLASSEKTRLACLPLPQPTASVIMGTNEMP